MNPARPGRLLLVHAHPDDETINNGVTMAKYVDLGFEVALVTCTRGEEGEILVPELAAAASDKEDRLAEIREVRIGSSARRFGGNAPLVPWLAAAHLSR